MERAEARRLQPHFIASFFREAFSHLGGIMREREPRRYEITNVPSVVRNRDRIIGMGEPVLPRYERVVFEKELITIQGKPVASFLCPGHPLLDATLDLVMERYRDLLKRGAILIDKENRKNDTRLLFSLEHSIQDARQDQAGNRRLVSRRLQFVEIDENGMAWDPGYAPYLDYEPLAEKERPLVESLLANAWLSEDLEKKVRGYAAEHLVPSHLQEVKERKEELVRKTMVAVKDRLTKEILYWDNRAIQLKLDEEKGKPLAKVNSALARQRADELEGRLKKRMEELEQERHLSPAPPIVIGGALVIPLCRLEEMRGTTSDERTVDQCSRELIDRRAIEAVVAEEKRRNRTPQVMEHSNPGYDIESRDSETGRLLFIEVKGKAAGATTVTVSKTQILTALNKPDDFILALVEVDGEKAGKPFYIKRPFFKEPDFAVTSVNFDLQELLATAEA